MVAIRLPTFKDYPFSKQALDYARQVKKGKIPTGKYTRLACERFIKDLARKDIEYRVDEAEKACKFIQLMPHTKGKWAKKRETLKLQPFQTFIIVNIFGWYKEGMRRFLESYIEIARKNGKSVLAAAIGLRFLVDDSDYGAEVYSGATTEKQAWEVFKPARLMAINTPDFTEYYDISINAKTLSINGTGAKFEPLIGDPGDGASPSLAIIDEYHEHVKPNLYDTMVTGMAARENPHALIITTAGSNIHGPCYEKRQTACRVLDGIHDNDDLFVCIFHADVEDEWSSWEAVEKANPNLGVSTSVRIMRSKLADAVANTSRQNIFRTKHLNQWVNAAEAWLNILEWMKCADNTPIEAFEGADCIGGLDLASRIDFAAYVRLFKKVIGGKTHYFFYPKLYLPEQAIDNDASGQYESWLKRDLMTITEGDELDFEVIRRDIEADLSRFNMLEIAYDPWRATQLAQQLAAQGANMIEFRGTPANCTQPMQEFEAAVKAGRLHHPNNEVYNWMASNVVAKTSDAGTIRPSKESTKNKIDGIVASIMGMARAIDDEFVQQNQYELRGLRTL